MRYAPVMAKLFIQAASCADRTTWVRPCGARVWPSLLVVCVAAGGCSSQQLYGAGQAWQKTECQRLPDADQRARCLKSSATSFDEYQRQAGALRTRP
jgi:hypothetical protein